MILSKDMDEVRVCHNIESGHWNDSHFKGFLLRWA